MRFIQVPAEREFTFVVTETELVQLNAMFDRCCVDTPMCAWSKTLQAAASRFHAICRQAGNS